MQLTVYGMENLCKNLSPEQFVAFQADLQGVIDRWYRTIFQMARLVPEQSNGSKPSEELTTTEEVHNG